MTEHHQRALDALVDLDVADRRPVDLGDRLHRADRVGGDDDPGDDELMIGEWR